jgi:signal peptidase II
MSSTRRLLLILTILFSCVGCDQATKSVAKAYLSETHTVVLLGDTVRLQLAKNYGAFLSLGSSVGEASRGVLFSVVVGAVLAAMHFPRRCCTDKPTTAISARHFPPADIPHH